MPDDNDVYDLFDEAFEHGVMAVAAAEGSDVIEQEHHRRIATMMLTAAIGKMRAVFGEAEANRIIRERAARAQEQEHKHG
jgi:hypothetical protein